MPKARAWRSTGKAKKRTHGAATLSQSAMPTRERLAKAATDFEIRGTGRHRVVRMLDAPLEQLWARAQITEQQYQVLGKLRLHWFLGHQAVSLRAADLNRIMAPHRDFGETSSQQALWHREMFDAGYSSLEALKSAVTYMVVLQEIGVNEVGAELGYRSPYRGRQFVIECLCVASAKIMSVWLTMDLDHTRS